MEESKCLVSLQETTMYPTPIAQLMIVTKTGETTAYLTQIAQLMGLIQIGQSFAVNVKL